MRFFIGFFLIPVLFSIVYNCVACFLSVRFRRMHAWTPSKQSDLSACVIRPLHGADSETYDCLASLCRQDRLPSEIRYGVDSAEDPAAAIFRKIKDDFPAIPMELRVGTVSRAPNRKMANLAKLADSVGDPVIVAVDQDIFAPSDHLRRVLAPFSDPRTGLVTSLYAIDDSKSLGSALELLAVHGDFFPSVLVGEMLEGGLSFAFGATVAVRPEILQALGGFQSLQDFLADDHEIGLRVKKLGYRVVLSDSIVRHHPGKLSLPDYWARQVRSARTHRVCRPGGYALSILTQGLPWLLGLSAVSPGSGAFWGAVWFFSRAGMLAGAHRVLSRSNGLPDRCSGSWWPLWLFPLHEVTRLASWIAAFAGSSVSWGGHDYLVGRDGRMREVREDPLQPSRK